MRKYNLFRISCITLLWLFLSGLVLRSHGFNGPSLLIIAMSGAIVFVPLYKRWKQESSQQATPKTKKRNRK